MDDLGKKIGSRSCRVGDSFAHRSSRVKKRWARCAGPSYAGRRTVRIVIFVVTFEISNIFDDHKGNR